MNKQVQPDDFFLTCLLAIGAPPPSILQGEVHVSNFIEFRREYLGHKKRTTTFLADAYPALTYHKYVTWYFAQQGEHGK